MNALDAVLGRRTRLLDPREPAECLAQPLQGAVNIPLTELPSRVHELPSASEPIELPRGQPNSEEAFAWLIEHGRKPLWRDPKPLPPGKPTERLRLWQPNEFLLDCLQYLPPEPLVIDLACGSGREVVALAALGWGVFAVDILPDALQKTADLVARNIPPERHKSVVTLETDLSRALPTPLRLASLVVSFRYLNRDLFASLPSMLLNPTAHVILETFTEKHRERHGKPSSSDHVLQKGELRDLLPGMHILHYSEAWRGESHTARLFAQKPKRR